MKNRVINACFFNMIEVVLAMAIIAFGMSSILGLFPVGLNALKSSMADNYCSDSVDQIVGYLKSQAEYTPAAYSDAKYIALITDPTTGLRDAAGLTTTLLADRSKAVNGSTLDGFRDTFLADYRTSNFTGTSTFKRVFTDMNIFQVQTYNNMPYLYFIAQGQVTSKNIDFSAMLLVWKSPVAYNMKDISGKVSPSTDTAYAKFAGINFEVRWPLEKPYAQREKRYYYVEVKRP